MVMETKYCILLQNDRFIVTVAKKYAMERKTAIETSVIAYEKRQLLRCNMQTQ